LFDYGAFASRVPREYFLFVFQILTVGIGFGWVLAWHSYDKYGGSRPRIRQARLGTQTAARAITVRHRVVFSSAPGAGAAPVAISRRAILAEILQSLAQHAPGSEQFNKIVFAQFATQMDGEQHARVRRLLMSAFLSRRIEQLQESITRIVDGMLNRIEANGPEFDGMQDYGGASRSRRLAGCHGEWTSAARRSSSRFTPWRGLCIALSIPLPEEATVARAVISNPKRHTSCEPLYDIDPQTGGSIEIFYADRVLAISFGMRDAGWFRWSCQPACLPEDPPVGPFATSYAAYRNFARQRGGS